MNTIIALYTGTGNSLYLAKRIPDAEIHFIRENYVRKEDMYRELGGWKTELNRLGDRIDKNQQENQKLLLELTKAIKDKEGE